MSRDIYVQDIPAEAQSVADIPDDWMPSPLPFGRDRIIAAVQELAPAADFSDPGWGRVALPGAEIEVNVGSESPLDSFALHIRASDSDAADEFVARLLDRLGVRAFDPEGAEASGIFGNG